MSAKRFRMSLTLSPATSASSPCDGLAPPHYSVLALTETNPTGKNTFFVQRFHGSRIGRVLVHVDHPGHSIAGRAQGLAEEAFGPGCVPFGCEQGFDGLARPVHCAII